MCLDWRSRQYSVTSTAHWLLAATQTSDLPRLVIIPGEVFFWALICSMVACWLRGVSFHLCQCAFPALSDTDVQDLGLSPFNTFSLSLSLMITDNTSLCLIPSFILFHPPPLPSVFAVKLCGCLPRDNFILTAYVPLCQECWCVCVCVSRGGC